MLAETILTFSHINLQNITEKHMSKEKKEKQLPCVTLGTCKITKKGLSD